jgi:tRNA(Ile)-lysidine synthase
VCATLSEQALRYHVAVDSLAHRLLLHIRRYELLWAGDRVGVAVSGGIDSVALLRLLLELRQELGVVVSVVHFNHKMRGEESEADQEFVAGLAREFGLEFYCSSGDVAELAAEQHSGLEAAAREMRYGFFRQLLGEGTSAAEAAVDSELNRSAGSAAPPQSALDGALDEIATGHTLDDQAETVLMRLIRGTGMRGLGGIYPRVVVSDDDDEECGEIVRPLLGIRSSELQQYLTDLKQPWREDSTNCDSKFTRNRVRKLVLPLLEREFNPAVAQSLAELAEIARDEEDYWENEVSGWLGTVVQWREPQSPLGLVQIQFDGTSVGDNARSNDTETGTPRGAGGAIESHGVLRSAQDDKNIEGAEASGGSISLSRPWLLTEPRAVQRRVLKAIGDEAGIPLEFKHVEEILRFAAEEGPSGKELALPLGWKLVREPEAMVFVTPDLRHQERSPDYEYLLSIPGQVAIPELGIAIEALCIGSAEGVAEYNPQQLLRADLLQSPLTVRNWRPGDRFWPAHTKAPKKVKELLQERHVAQPKRRLWPVVVSRGEIVWMRGFPVPANLLADGKQEAVAIREIGDEAEEQDG